MPAPYKISPTTNSNVWWIEWTLIYKNGRTFPVTKRTNRRLMLQFCKRHGLTPPAISERGKRR